VKSGLFHKIWLSSHFSFLKGDLKLIVCGVFLLFFINQEQNMGADTAIENITTEYKTKNTKILR
jgi:hypothetical protein